MTTVPPGFDWVEARHQCSAREQFMQLRLAAQANIAKRNEQVKHPKEPREQFGLKDIRSASSTPFVVYDKLTQQSVTCPLQGDTIRFWHRSSQEHSFLTLSLNDEGKCRFMLEASELDLWQVLKRALEPLLFAP